MKRPEFEYLELGRRLHKALGTPKHEELRQKARKMVEEEDPKLAVVAVHLIRRGTQEARNGR